MSVRIVLYDKASMERVKKKFLKQYDDKSEICIMNNMICLENMYIRFQERLVIINVYNKNYGECKLQELLDEILKNEQVSICSNDRIEYSDCHGKGNNLVITYN